MITVEVDGMPALDVEDWRELARACQYAHDHLWCEDTRRPAWLRLRNLALECAVLRGTIDNLERFPHGVLRSQKEVR